MEIRELTKAEEQIMQVLWDMGKGFVKDVLDRLPEPIPAYNTVSTIIRILEKKGFVGYKAYGKSHEYFPLISREDYKSFAMTQVLGGYFNNSMHSLVSFFAGKQQIDIKEADAIIGLLEKIKKQQS